MSEISEFNHNFDLRTKQIVTGWGWVGYDGEDPKISKFYNKFSGSTKGIKSMFEGKKLADIFIFSMILGKKAGITKDYKKKADRKATINIEYIASNPEYIWMMIAIALEETKGDITIFQEPKRIIDICEKYANYGITLLIDMEEERGTTTDPHLGYEEKFQELLNELKD